MDDELKAALRVAYRHIDASTTTDAEREAVLASIVTHHDVAEADAAGRVLFHLREQRKCQLTLGAILEGVGTERKAQG